MISSSCAAASRLQLDAVDVRAVVRAEIFERPAVAVLPQPRVLADTRMSGTKIWQSERRPITYSPSPSL
jgi:hypothetical protein